MAKPIATVAAVGPLMWMRLLGVLALSASIPGVAVFAAECGTLKRVGAIDLITAPNGVQIVPVTINGVPKKLLLGTAGGLSTLSKLAVEDLGLRVYSIRRGPRLLNRAGDASSAFVSVKSFESGSLRAKNVAFMVSPNPQMGSNPALPIDGELAGDLFDAFDVEMDFAGSKLNYFLPDHCDGAVVYWPAKTVAIVPYRSTNPRTNLPDSHIRVPVTVDGKELNAVIDTGSARSSISASTAEFVFQVTAESPGAVPLGTVANDPEHKVFSYVFASLAFEGVTVSNPRIVVFPDLVGSKDPSNTLRTGSHIKRVDDGVGSEFNIGMDVLKKLHLYVASREHKLYITSATSTADH